jgi:DNA polymerase V
MILDVLETTGITATAGIGTNLYLCKIAMDIEAKHIPPNEHGVRIAELDERSYREKLWSHRPITDFWRVGRGSANRLEAHGLYTMGDVARCSLQNEDLLYRLFGVNAELLIDHAWGWEPCTIADIKAYKPATNSVSSGQVLQYPYDFLKTRLIVREMTELLALDLVDKGLMTNRLVLTIGYDIENLTDPQRRSRYKGPVTVDRYGRQVPKHAHGTTSLGRYTSSTRQLVAAAMELFDRIVDPGLLTRRVTVVADHVLDEAAVLEAQPMEQLDLFTDPAVREEEKAALERERRMQQAVLTIQKKYGKNAILKGMNLEEGATTRERNDQIGGHKA